MQKCVGAIHYYTLCAKVKIIIGNKESYEVWSTVSDWFEEKRVYTEEVAKSGQLEVGCVSWTKDLNAAPHRLDYGKDAG